MNKIALSIAVSIMGLALAVPVVVAQPVSLAAASKAEQRKQKAASVARATARAKAALLAKKKARAALADAQAARKKSKAAPGTPEWVNLANAETAAGVAVESAVQNRIAMKQGLAKRRKEKLDAFIARADATNLSIWRTNQANAARQLAPAGPAIAQGAGPMGRQPAGAGNPQVARNPGAVSPVFGNLPRRPVQYTALPPDRRQQTYVALPPEGQAARQPAAAGAGNQYNPAPAQPANAGANPPAGGGPGQAYGPAPQLPQVYAATPALLAAARRNAQAQAQNPRYDRVEDNQYDRVDQPLNLD